MKEELRKILADATPEVLRKIREIIDSKDNEKLKSYLESLLNSTKKIESSTKSEKSKTIKITAGNKVLAYFNISDYDWVRYKGKKTKNIPYAGMILHLEPEDVYGVARSVDGYGKYKVIMPTYKKQVITLEKAIVDLIKDRSNPFNGNVALIFKTTAEKKPEIIECASYDFSALRDIANTFIDGHNLYIESIKNFEDLRVASNEQKNTLKTLKSDSKSYYRNMSDYLSTKRDELLKYKEKGKISEDDYKKAINIIFKALDSVIKNPTSKIKNI